MRLYTLQDYDINKNKANIFHKNSIYNEEEFESFKFGIKFISYKLDRNDFIWCLNIKHDVSDWNIERLLNKKHYLYELEIPNKYILAMINDENWYMLKVGENIIENVFDSFSNIENYNEFLIPSPIKKEWIIKKIIITRQLLLINTFKILLYNLNDIILSFIKRDYNINMLIEYTIIDLKSTWNKLKTILFSMRHISQ